MSSSVVETRVALATGVVVSKDTLSVKLADGRTIAAPLAWYPRLSHATTQERNSWRLIANGQGIHWRTSMKTLESIICSRVNPRPKARVRSRSGLRAGPSRPADGRDRKPDQEVGRKALLDESVVENPTKPQHASFSQTPSRTGEERIGTRHGDQEMRGRDQRPLPASQPAGGPDQRCVLSQESTLIEGYRTTATSETPKSQGNRPTGPASRRSSSGRSRHSSAISKDSMPRSVNASSIPSTPNVHSGSRIDESGEDLPSPLSFPAPRWTGIVAV